MGLDPAGLDAEVLQQGIAHQMGCLAECIADAEVDVGLAEDRWD